MKISNETKVGVMALFAIIILILGFNFLKGNDLFTREIKLSARYTDIDGLNKGNPVLLYGLSVGRVDDMELINESGKKVRVKFHINADIKLPANSKARIISSDLLGSKAMVIEPGNSTSFVSNNDTISGTVELSLSSSISKVVAPVKEKLESLIGSVDTVVTGINEIFNAQTKSDLRLSFHSIKHTVNNIDRTTSQLDSFTKDESGRIKTILMDIQSVASNLKNNNAAITRAIDNFSAISDSLRASKLKSTIFEANKAMLQLNDVLAKIKDGKGTLGMLVNDDKMYNNLEAASKNLDILVRDLKANPKRYVHFSVFGGGKDKKAQKSGDSSGK